MTMIEQILKMNNQGATQMAHGDYDSATSTFTSGLVALKTLLLDVGSTVCNESAKKSNSSLSCSFFHNDDSYQQQCNQQYGGVERIQHCSHQVYQYPIILNQVHNNKMSPRTTRNISYSASNMLSFVLIYNLALSLQMNAKSQNSLVGTKKACSLYERAYQVLIEQELDLDAQYNLAIINNLGQAQYALGNKVQSQQCLERMLTIIMFINSQNGSSNYEEENKENDLELFVENIIPLMSKCSSAPAA